MSRVEKRMERFILEQGHNSNAAKCNGRESIAKNTKAAKSDMIRDRFD